MGEKDRLDKARLRELLVKRDGPGLVRISVQIIWFIASLALGSYFYTRGMHIPMAIAIFSAGMAHVTFFPPMHEAGHKTAFATSWLNEAVMWWCCLMMLEGPTFFREFHWEHHRETQDPALDPEIAGAPALLDGWPTNPLVYFALVSGQMLMIGKLMFTIGGALMPTAGLWEKVFPFIPEKKRRRVRLESFAVLALLGGIGALGYLLVPGFLYLLLSIVIGHVLLGFYLMAEHTGLPNEGSQTHRTRTIESNALVRWLMWNMPYHTAHHEHPAIPFHAVPEARAEMTPEHVTSGYIAFHIEAASRAFWLRRDAD